MGIKSQAGFSMFQGDIKPSSPEKQTKQILFNAYSPVKDQTPEKPNVDLNPYSPVV